MELSSQHLVGMGLALILVFGLGVYAGRKVNTSVDFSITGRQSGSALVAGTIMGTLIGGASTVGTAQLAFLYGFSAWWFTLGGGLACLLIGLFLVRPLRDTRFETIPQFLSASFGPQAGVMAALFVSLGMFINIVPQVISSAALLRSMFPINGALAGLIAVALMALYVIFGGLWGTGLMGVCKVLLTGASLITAGGLALHYLGGFSGMLDTFPRFPWFSLFGRGVNTDLAAAFSLLVGVLSSQIYFQAIFSSRNVRSAREGALISSFLGPAIGFGGILVGMYMRTTSPDIIPSMALPLFIIQHLPAGFAGMAMATLLLAAVGTGAGLTLGVSTMLSRDIYQRIRPEADDRRVLFMFRFFIVLIMVLALATIYFSGSDVIILQWSYLSQGLRGATICFPLLSVIFFKDKISASAGRRAVFWGPVSVITGTLAGIPLNPLYIGLAISLSVLVIDYHKNTNKRIDPTNPAGL